MRRALLTVLAVGAVAVITACSVPAGSTEDPLAGLKGQVYSWCDNRDKVFVYVGSKKGGLSVLAGHPDCVVER